MACAERPHLTHEDSGEPSTGRSRQRRIPISPRTSEDRAAGGALTKRFIFTLIRCLPGETMVAVERLAENFCHS